MTRSHPARLTADLVLGALHAAGIDACLDSGLAAAVVSEIRVGQPDGTWQPVVSVYCRTVAVGTMVDQLNAAFPGRQRPAYTLDTDSAVIPVR